MTKRDRLVKNRLRPIVRPLFNAVIWTLDFVIPKNQDLWVFANGAGKHWGGNHRAVCEAIRKDDQVRVVIANSGATMCSSIEDLYGSQIQVVSTRTISGLWAVLRCRVLFVTHGLADAFWPVRSGKRLVVNLWHGTPLKGIGFFDASAKEWQLERFFREKETYGAVISSSEVDRLAMMASFNLTPPKVWTTGLPRNDWLIQDSHDLPTDLCEMELKLKTLVGERRLVLYAPTFRGDGSGLYPFTASQADELAALLRKKNAVLGVRAHINREERPAFVDRPEFLDLSYQVCPEPQIALRVTDVLITDYSSIWVDFLLMNRPIIGFVHDWDDYVEKRGFIYNYESIFPGALVRRFSDLKNALADALDVKRSYELRLRHKNALDLFHAYRDGQSRHRVIERIKSIN